MTSNQWLQLTESKAIPLILLIGAGVAYKLGLPDHYCEGIAAAGLMAFQMRGASAATSSTTSQSPQ